MSIIKLTFQLLVNEATVALNYTMESKVKME